VVTAAPAEIPAPLLEQLELGAKLVIPVGREDQMLRVVERTKEGLEERGLYPVRFVPLVREPES
jgi:protein-L-isoaspartate(D-aspartate) O-methyltransferase